MKVEISYIELLLEQLSIQTRQSLDHNGFGIMEEALEGIVSQKYLYERLHKDSEKAKKGGNNHLTLHPKNIDEIAKFLGHKSFADFTLSIDQPIDPILKKSVGNYYCYLRRTTEKGVVFKSPAKFVEENHKIWLIMKGPQRKFKGEVKLINGCLICLLIARTNDKVFHHVYQIGKREYPEVLLGIFSGISTSGFPIGGRTVLTKHNQDFENMDTQEMSVIDMERSKDIINRRLSEYFNQFARNNLQVPRSTTFNIDDLGSCD